MPELLHKRDFSDGSRGRALLSIEMDLLKGDDFIRRPRSSLVHGGVRSLACRVVVQCQSVSVVWRGHVYQACIADLPNFSSSVEWSGGDKRSQLLGHLPDIHRPRSRM